MNIYPVILCGGSGTRLWPLSRKSLPKQFALLAGKKSLFQQCLGRCKNEILRPPIIVTSDDFRFIVAQQLLDEDITPHTIILEPSPKNTAPAIMAAANYISKSDPNGLLLIMPSDHHIPDKNAFINGVMDAKEFALTGKIVTFGIVPSRPETNYGYMNVSKGSKIIGFHEKPDKETAVEMFSSGEYLWNAGIFFASCQSILQAGKKTVPSMLTSVKKALKKSSTDLDFLRLDQKSWQEIDANSFDYAIMESSDNIHVLPFSGEWSDLGDWGELSKHLSHSVAHDKFDTVTIGNVTQIDTHNSFLWAEDDATVLTSIGLKNIIAIAMADAVLIADIDSVQNVKSIVTELTKKSVSQAEYHKREYRPWGWFESLIKADTYQVKRLCILAGAMLSMQSHKHRSEHWVVTAGTATVQLNEIVTILKTNQSTYIESGKVHRLSNQTKEPLFVIEIQTGSYLGEDDIIRYDDIYSRI